MPANCPLQASASRVSRLVRVRISSCSKRQKQLGAVQDLLASWCTLCTMAAERESICCHECWEKRRHLSCRHCGRADDVKDNKILCAESSCTTRFNLCRLCSPLLRIYKLVFLVSWGAPGLSWGSLVALWTSFTNWGPFLVGFGALRVTFETPRSS